MSLSAEGQMAKYYISRWGFVYVAGPLREDHDGKEERESVRW
jgi:hypothetical protein